MNFITTTPVQNTKIEISNDILDDLASRFLINIPDSEKNVIRLFFLIEQAHWFYLDFYCAQSDKIQPCGIRQFAWNILDHVPAFKKHVSALDTILEEWRVYKSSVPTYGAILLTEDLNHVLLVQSFFAKNSWGFPKGKVNQEEDPVRCAIREVDEETGYNCETLINPNDFLENTLNYQYIRLYIVRGVPYRTKFEPKSRNEIRECAWFKIEDLPSSRYDEPVMKDMRKIRANSFYMIIPFIKNLKKWIFDSRNRNIKGNGNKSNRKNQQKQGSSSPFFSNNADQNRNRQRHKSLGDAEYHLTQYDTNSNSNSNQKQPYTSTPINQSSLLQSASSAFRMTSNENSKSTTSKKKNNRSQVNQFNQFQFNQIQQQHHQPQPQQVQIPQQQQDHIKRKLFTDATKDIKTTTGKKSFNMHNDENGIPFAWRNFTFNKDKLMSIIANS